MRPLITRPVPPSKEMVKLMNRLEARRWQTDELDRTMFNLEWTQQQISWIEHIRSCRQCQIEMQINIERYCGSRGPWYLNLEGEMCFPEIYEEEGIYKTCPKPQDYKIGYYGHSSEDTIRFILDRCKWAEAIIRSDIEILVDYYVDMEEWDLEASPPPDTTSLIYQIVWG